MGKNQKKSNKALKMTLIGAVVLFLAAFIIALGSGKMLGYIPAGKGYGVMFTINSWLAMFSGSSSKAMFACAIIVGVDLVCFLAVSVYACIHKKPFYMLPAFGAFCAIGFVPFDGILALGILNHNAMTVVGLFVILLSVTLLLLGWIMMIGAMKGLLVTFLAPEIEAAKEEAGIVEEKPVEESPVAVEEEKPAEEEKVEEPIEEEKAEEPTEEPVEEDKVEEVAEEEKPAEEPVAEEPVEEAAPVEETSAEEEKAEEPTEEPAAAEEPAAESATAGLNDIERKSFAEKLALADEDLRSKYENLKAEALAYGLKGRVSNSGDTYHLGRKNYLKIVLIGKTLKVYFALDPKEYADSPIPVEDVSGKKAFAEMPSLFRVKSDLSLRRAKKLLADMMAADGIERSEEPVVEETPVAEEGAVEEAKVLGKYEVYPEEDEFKYRLKANNGEILIVSNGYSTRAGAKAGIETLRKNVEAGVVRVVTDKNGYSQFRIFTANEARLVVSGEFYKVASRAESALESVKRFYATDKVVDLDEIPAAERREWIYDAKKEEDKENGKIELFKDEADKWLGRLVASNGEVLFVTAGNYASKSGLLEALETIKGIVAKENAFRIMKDKQDRYQFVVESGNGSILVLGETYASADSARSAAVSVLSFLEKAEVVDTTVAVEEAE